MMFNKNFFIILLSCVAILFFGLGINSAYAGGLCAECSSDRDCDSGFECINDRCQIACPSGQICIPNPLKACSLSHLVEMIAILIFNIALVVAPVMIIVGGFFFVTAAGNPEGIKTGKAIVLWTIIGFSVILLARGIISFFIKIFVVE